MQIRMDYRTWKSDLSTDDTLLEAGLDRFVKLDKPQDFPGKAALLNEKQQGSRKRFVTRVVDVGDRDALYMSPLCTGSRMVGETTSGDRGYRVGKSIALGMLRDGLAVAGAEIQVEICGQRRRATVQPDAPLRDLQNERLRA
jgi:dimethylglycine dehydrogenase